MSSKCALLDNPEYLIGNVSSRIFLWFLENILFTKEVLNVDNKILLILFSQTGNSFKSHDYTWLSLESKFSNFADKNYCPIALYTMPFFQCLLLAMICETTE